MLTLGQMIMLAVLAYAALLFGIGAWRNRRGDYACIDGMLWVVLGALIPVCVVIALGGLVKIWNDLGAPS